MSFALSIVCVATAVGNPPSTSLEDHPPTTILKHVRPGTLRAGKDQWRVIDFRTGGVSRVSKIQLDADGHLGALEQILPAPGSVEFSTEVELLSRDTIHDPTAGLVPTRGGFGLVSDLKHLELSWYRDSASTTVPLQATALRVYIYDPDLGAEGTSYTLVWEPFYNGYATLPGRSVPTDTWIRSNVTDDFFWRTPLYLDGLRVPTDFCRQNSRECYIFNRTIGEWDFGPRAVIFGLSLAAGSGWSGSYQGYVDHVVMEVDDQRWAWDFAPGRRYALSKASKAQK